MSSIASASNFRAAILVSFSNLASLIKDLNSAVLALNSSLDNAISADSNAFIFVTKG